MRSLLRGVAELVLLYVDSIRAISRLALSLSDTKKKK